MTSDTYDTMASEAGRRHPGYGLDAIYSAYWPTYRILLSVDILERCQIPVVAGHILRLVDNDISDISEIARLLCLPEQYIAYASSGLLRQGLIKRDPDMSMYVTSRGKDAVSSRHIKLPRIRHLGIPFDPITQTIPYDLSLDRLVASKKSDGRFLIRYDGTKPHDISLEDIKRYHGSQKYDIIGVSDIKDIRLQYWHIDIVKLSHIDTDDILFLAYDRCHPLDVQTRHLRHIAGLGVNLVPGEYERFVPVWDLVQNVSPDVRCIIKEINDLYMEEDRIRQHTRDIISGQPVSTVNDSTAEQIARNESRLDTITGGMIGLVNICEYRDLLVRTIDSAVDNITLASAWLYPHTLDGRVGKRLVAAAKRGVTVCIIWGYHTNNNKTESRRNQINGERACQNLYRLFDKTGNLTVHHTDTLDKRFIICDDRFIICGCPPYDGREFRQKICMRSARPDDVAFWKSHARTLIQAAESNKSPSRRYL